MQRKRRATASFYMDFNQDFFSLFGLPQRFSLDRATLDRAFRELQMRVHPDKFAHANDAEKRLSMQWATQVNEAYQTLRDPLRRARYVLSLRGVETQEETNTAMAPEFLMQQMEWREAIADAKASRDTGAIEALAQHIAGRSKDCHTELEQAIDIDGNLDKAAAIVRKLRFVEKLQEEAISAAETIDA